MCKRNYLILWLAGCCALRIFPVCGQEASEPFRPLETAAQVLAFARAGLPQEPLRIEGTLSVKAANNFTRFQYPVRMHLDWSARLAEYQLLDASGQPEETVEVRYPETGSPVFRRFAGLEKKPLPPPGPLEPVRESDLSWSDLSLAFLWWPNGRLMDYASRRGFDCYVLELPAPSDNESGIAFVRLWIHQRLGLLIEAAMYGPDERLIKRLRVVSIRKTEDGLSMVKDIEMIRPLTDALTRLRVDSVERAGQNTGRE